MLNSASCKLQNSPLRHRESHQYVGWKLTSGTPAVDLQLFQLTMILLPFLASKQSLTCSHWHLQQTKFHSSTLHVML